MGVVRLRNSVGSSFPASGCCLLCTRAPERDCASVAREHFARAPPLHLKYGHELRSQGIDTPRYDSPTSAAGRRARLCSCRRSAIPVSACVMSSRVRPGLSGFRAYVCLLTDTYFFVSFLGGSRFLTLLALLPTPCRL